MIRGVRGTVYLFHVSKEFIYCLRNFNSGFRAGDAAGSRRIDQQATGWDLRAAYAAIPEVSSFDAA